jgi:hypothetical protein
MGRQPAVLPILAAAMLFGAGACLPIPRTVTLSPEIEGSYLREDHTPIAGARVLLSTVPRDSTCANPVSSAVTDAQGRFQMAATSRREPVILLIPGLDRVFCYQLCGGRSEPLHGAETACELHSMQPVQKIRCVEYPMFARPDTVRLACYRQPRKDGT